jgi:hypothetical protein
VVLCEDEEAVWIEERGDRRAVTRAPVRLVSFSGYPQASLLRVLQGELLMHILPWGPVPNLWVYPRPWYRDAAMMAMALAKTGNARLLEPWIAGLEQPYDYNNRGHAETDNLGQVLYLASLAGGRSHRIVDRALAAARQVRKEEHLSGLSDYAEHPVYQTKRLNFGLRALGLDDSPWKIPAVADRYSALFWMGDRDQHVEMPRFDAKTLADYPYLNWAEAHFYAEPPPEHVTADTFPLTREVRSSEANYGRMAMVSPALATAKWSSPHTWHAAEMFLYFLDGDGEIPRGQTSNPLALGMT